MLIDTSVTIAYKCTSCGSFEFFNTSLFILMYKKNCSLSCRCRMSSIKIKQEGERNYFIAIPCIGCGSEHTFLLTKRNILMCDPIVFDCPETGMHICFVGRDDVVRKKVDSLEEEFDELMDMYGYESYFRNTQVMFDMLNRVHDIALKGNLYCECGSVDIELILLSDCILLRCVKCGCDTKIPAARNNDLKGMAAQGHILITDRKFQREFDINETILSGHSAKKLGK